MNRSVSHSTRLTVLLALFTTVAVALLAACQAPTGFDQFRGSGNLETRHFAFADFTEIEASSAFRVTLIPGDAYDVAVTADDNLWQGTEVLQAGERIILRRNFAGVGGGTMEATITLPVLKELHLAGASWADFAGFASESPFTLTATGASRADGEIEAGDTTVELSGSSRAVLAGSGNALHIDATGASSANLENFAVVDADVRVQGATFATVAPSGRLNVDAGGASRVFYVGDPVLGVITANGASTVERR